MAMCVAVLFLRPPAAWPAPGASTSGESLTCQRPPASLLRACAALRNAQAETGGLVGQRRTLERERQARGGARAASGGWRLALPVVAGLAAKLGNFETP